MSQRIISAIDTLASCLRAGREVGQAQFEALEILEDFQVSLREAGTFVVADGDAFSGITLYGPFVTRDEAARYAQGVARIVQLKAAE